MKGEIIQEGDELDLCRDSWRDDPKLTKATKHNIGHIVSDPTCPAHVLVRREVNEGYDLL